jgi:hypothetical protein
MFHFAQGSKRTIRDNAESITENIRSGTKNLHSSIGMNHTKNYGYDSLKLLLH